MYRQVDDRKSHLVTTDGEYESRIEELENIDFAEFVTDKTISITKICLYIWTIVSIILVFYNYLFHQEPKLKHRNRADQWHISGIMCFSFGILFSIS